MDRLARNAMLARQANMSYGKWKAMQEPVKIVQKEEKHYCLNCGKEVFPRIKAAPKYCDSYCGDQYRRKKYMEVSVGDDAEICKQLMLKHKYAMKLGCCEEWEDFDVFYKWAMDNGYEDGMTMKRYWEDRLYSPINCYFMVGERPRKDFNEAEFSKRWTETVNRIRKHYRMEMIGVK